MAARSEALRVAKKGGAGHVEMEAQDALSAKDRAQGLILACQATSAGALTVDA